MKRTVLRCVLSCACVLGAPLSVLAQATIAGVARDASQAVLPGVTVEAASPALIEKVRSVTTDGTGQYRIVDLRPGTYTITFSLAGFNTVRRDGVEITGSSTFQVNAEMRVGAIEETITVTGEAPIVDVQTVKTQSVLNEEVLTALPTARNYESLHILIPGVTVASGSQDVGGSSTNSLVYFSAHGGNVFDSRVLVNGISIADAQSNGGRSMWVPNVGASQEVSVTTSSGGLGEAESAGVVVNMIFKDGGNTFRGSLFGSGASEGMAGDNYTEELRAAGLRAPNKVKDTFDWEVNGGGPIVKDRLWFFADTRYHGFSNYAAGMFANKNAGDITKWTYEPDQTKQAFSDTNWKNVSLRLTWQATPRNKIAVFHDDQLRCANCTSGGSPTASPESVGKQTAHPNNFSQLIWTSPVTNRFLLEAGTGIRPLRYGGNEPYPGAPPFNPDMIRVTEQAGLIPGLAYRAVANTAKPFIGDYGYRASLAYISGANSMKFGLSGDFHRLSQREDSFTSLQYRFRNAVPNQLTQFAHPFEYWEHLHQWGLYAQDQWTFKRLTLSGGLRFDKFSAYFPDGHLGPSRFIASELIVPAAETVSLNDITPRGSLAYDLFGDGKTAFKVSLGKYVIQQNAHNAVLGGQTAPMNRVAISTSRSWNDANRDYVPDCNLLSPAANGECGAWSNQSFGQPAVTTRLDPEITQGWGVRPYNWAFDLQMQREIIPRVSANVGYFRRWYGNHLVTDNKALSPSDYTFFDLPLANDPRLPISGTVHGFFDVVPEKFGVFDNLVTSADNYGKVKENWHGVDATVNARIQGLTLQGGVSTGRLSRDLCDVTSKNPTMLMFAYERDGVGRGGRPIPREYCDMEQSWQTQLKMLGAYRIPKIEVEVAGTLQDIPGQEIEAAYVAPNSVVAPLLGRNLSGGAANITLNLLPPGQDFSDRVRQFDVRFAKILRLPDNRRLQVSFDLYNAFNSSVVQTYNSAYDPVGAWRIPTGILPARLSKVTAQFDF